MNKNPGEKISSPPPEEKNLEEVSPDFDANKSRGQKTAEAFNETPEQKISKKLDNGRRVAIKLGIPANLYDELSLKRRVALSAIDADAETKPGREKADVFGFDGLTEKDTDGPKLYPYTKNFRENLEFKFLRDLASSSRLESFAKDFNKTWKAQVSANSSALREKLKTGYSAKQESLREESKQLDFSRQLSRDLREQYGEDLGRQKYREEMEKILIRDGIMSETEISDYKKLRGTQQVQLIAKKYVDSIHYDERNISKTQATSKLESFINASFKNDRNADRGETPLSEEQLAKRQKGLLRFFDSLNISEKDQPLEEFLQEAKKTYDYFQKLQTTYRDNIDFHRYNPTVAEKKKTDQEIRDISAKRRRAKSTAEQISLSQTQAALAKQVDFPEEITEIYFLPGFILGAKKGETISVAKKIDEDFFDQDLEDENLKSAYDFIKDSLSKITPEMDQFARRVINAQANYDSTIGEIRFGNKIDHAIADFEENNSHLSPLKDSCVDLRSGKFEPELTLQEIETWDKIAPTFGKFIKSISLSGQDNFKNYAELSAARRKFLSGESSIFSEIVSNGSLNIKQLQALVAAYPKSIKVVGLFSDAIAIDLFRNLSDEQKAQYRALTGNRDKISREAFFSRYRRHISDAQERCIISRRTIFCHDFAKYITNNANEDIKTFFDSLRTS